MDQAILVTNETPNDQGSIVRTNTIDFSRFDANPLMLYHHGEDSELRDMPIGHWENRIVKGTAVYMTPVFSDIDNAKVKDIRKLYEEGNLKAASIGGPITYKQDEIRGRDFINKDGYRESDYFLMYECSIVPMPSNPDSLKISLGAKFYEFDKLSIKQEEILQLKSKFTMEKEIKVDPKDKNLESGHEELGTFVSSMVEGLKSPSAIGKFFSKLLNLKSEATVVDPDEVNRKTKIPETGTNLPENGVVSEAELEARKLDAEAKTLESEGDSMAKKSAAKKAEASLKRAEAKRAEAKRFEEEAKKAETETEAEGKRAKAEACNKEAVKFEEEAKKYEAEADEEADEEAKVKKAEAKKAEADAAKNSAALQTAYENLPPVIKKIIDDAGDSVKLRTDEEMLQLSTDGKVKLAPKPNMQIDVKNFSKTYTELSADLEGKKIIERVSNSFGSVLTPQDHFLVLQSMLNDKRRFGEVFKKLRITCQTSFANYKENTVYDLARMCANPTGVFNIKTGQRAKMATFGTTDDALASPENLAVEWLNIIYFTLFPSAEWKAEIPIFAATATDKNRGVIWTNVKANPTVYEGTKPTPTDYDQSSVDTAVSMSLKPFWLQPMIWTPELMAQVRYDMMGSGWAQGLMKFRSSIDEYLIYELASLIPSASILFTVGDTFYIASSSDPNSFKLNPSFSSTSGLLKAKITDAARMEQVFIRQNYELPEGASIIAVFDPTMDLQVKLDPDTKSLLTRFVRSGKDELEGYSKVGFRKRSQLALYDPATSAVIDPTGVIPPTTVSAGLFFVPSQVGIGLANLDVFMVQQPAAYGISMSCDTRQGIALMRDTGYGAGLYTYGPASGSPV